MADLLPNLIYLPQISPSLLLDHAVKRLRPETSKPTALIKSNQHKDPSLPISIHNYTQETFTRSLWDPITIACRALITETETGKVVARSFPKFFNFHEKNAYVPTGREAFMVVEEKLDGSIGLLFNYRDRWIWSSKSVFDSPHVGYAEEILAGKYNGVTGTLDKELTYVFEIIHPDNIIGVHYGGRKDLVLLAAFYKDGSELPPDFDWSVLPFPRPKVYDAANTRDMKKLQAIDTPNSEGFVLRFYETPTDPRPQRIKIKFERYLQFIKAKECHAASPADLFEYYGRKVLATGSFDPDVVVPKMLEVRRDYVDTLQKLSDDFEGESWVQGIEAVWDSIDSLYQGIGKRWGDILKILGREGFSGRDKTWKRQFALRIGKEDIEKKFRPALFAWYDKKEDMALKALVRLIEAPPVPPGSKDLRVNEKIVMVGQGDT